MNIEKLGIAPGPWKFDVRPKSHHCVLSSPNSDIAMDLRRWGMHGAQPYFPKDGLIYPVEKFAQPIKGREHHTWIAEINHPNAKTIEAAPEMLKALISDGIDYLETLELGGYPTPSMRVKYARNSQIIFDITGKSIQQIKELIS